MKETSSVLGVQQDIDIPSDAASYEHWRKTGETELPPTEDKPDKPAAEETETPATETKSVEPKAEPDAAKPSAQPQGKRDANARIRQLNEELRKERELNRRLQDERLSAGTRTAATDETRKSSAATADTSKPAAAASDAEPQIDDKNPDGSAKYKTYGEFQKAWQKWTRDDIKRTVEVTMTETQTRSQKEQRDREAAEAERVIKEGFSKRVVEATKKYPDFHEVALADNLQITKGSAVEAFILESKLGTDVLYYLGQHPDELEAMTGLSQERDDKGNFVRVGKGMTPAMLYRELSMIELSLLPDEEEGEGAGAGKAPATALPPKPAAKPVSKAPPPPRQVAGKPPASAREVEQAVEADDTDAYIQAANREEIARRRAQRARGR